MKILVVCQYYQPEPFRIADICAALVEAGHEVTVVTGTPNYPEGEIYPGYEGAAHRDEVLDGVRVHRCPIHPRKRGSVHRFWNYYSFVFASRRYLAGLEESFDVVFVNQLSPVMMAEGALAWAKRHGKPCVLYCLDLWPESLTAGGIRSGSLVYRVFLAISRRIYRAADRILVTSRGFFPYFREVLGMDDGALRYLPQYAEDQFEAVPPVEAHPGPLVFLFAGNIGEAQSVETIVEAARLLKDDPRVRFHIVGDGVRLEACRTLAEGLPNITFYGRRDITEMPDFYAGADAMLVTLKDSGAISGTLPGKVQSYLAAGRAIVSAAGGETSAVLANAGCGLCGPAGDAAALAANIRTLAEDPALLRQYGEQARAYYRENFRKDAFLRKLTETLEEACR